MSGLFVSVLPVLTPHLCSASSVYMAHLGSGPAFDRSSNLAIHTPTLFPHAFCLPWAWITASSSHTESYGEFLTCASTFPREVPFVSDVCQYFRIKFTTCILNFNSTPKIFWPSSYANSYGEFLTCASTPPREVPFVSDVCQYFRIKIHHVHPDPEL